MAHPLSSRVLPPFTDVLLTTVQPLEKTAHGQSIDPTILDLLLPERYIPVLFAYRPAKDSECVYSQMVERLKESLAKVLIPFFSFAGRWVAVSQGSRRRKLLCNDEGVPFIEAYMDTDLDSILHASTAFQPVPELQGHGFLGMDMTQYTQRLPTDGAPPIFVQCTRFRCGGLVLAVTFNHMHVDGQGFFSFIRAWSDLSRTNETAVKVDHNRAQVEVPALKALLPDQVLPKAASANGVDDAKPAAKPGLWAMKFFEVGASTIKSLKDEAKRNREGRGYVSTGDCIVAQLWRSFEAHRSSVLGEKELVVSRAVEGRTRFFDTPLPDVCGNVWTLLPPPKVPTSELLQLPVVSIASRLREQLETTKREEWLSLEMLRQAFQARGSTEQKNFRTTSWVNFGMYEMDFGFGKPYFAVAPNCNGSADALGAAVIFPPIPSRSSSVATVNIGTTPDVFQALESDPQFLDFFHAH